MMTRAGSPSIAVNLTDMDRARVAARRVTPGIPMSTAAADLQTGQEALTRGAWEEARAALNVAGAHETPEALEGLGLAAWWLDDADVVFESRERAYTLYLERGDRVWRARIAVWLAWDCWAFRGEHAVANGWLQRRGVISRASAILERAWLEAREEPAGAARRRRSRPRAPSCGRSGPRRARGRQHRLRDARARRFRGWRSSRRAPWPRACACSTK